MLRWIGDIRIKTKSRPDRPGKRIYIPMGGAGFLFNNIDSPQGFSLVTSLGQRTSITTSGVATCVALILYHEDTNSGMLAHFTSDNEKGKPAAALEICREMIENFTGKLHISPQDLEARICYRLDVSAESTCNIVAQLKEVFAVVNIHDEDFIDKALYGGFPGTDIYLNLQTREGGVYSESFGEDYTDMAESAADDVQSPCFRTFPLTEKFEYYVLTSPLKFISQDIYAATHLVEVDYAYQ